MKITREMLLSDFEFWSGAKSLANELQPNEFDAIEALLEEEYPEGIDAGTLNDFFWFEGETIAEWLGYEKEEDILLRNDPAHLLIIASNYIENIRDENYYATEFVFDDVEHFLTEHSMTKEEFLADGWKTYIAELDEITPEEVDVDIYKETLQFLHLELLLNDIEDNVRNKNFSDDIRDAVVNTLEDISEKADSKTEEYIDLLLRDIQNCDKFVELEQDIER